MSHSPGPWKARDGQVFGPDPHEDGEVLICDTAPDGAALTEYDADNACLIAAVPDLLAAAERALSALRTNGAPNCEAAKELRAAIAKAKRGAA